MGRWDEDTSKRLLDLDLSILVLLAIGFALTKVSATANIVWSVPISEFMVTGLPIQIFFVVSGIVVSIIGIMLLLVDTGYIRVKPFKYEDDKFA